MRVYQKILSKGGIIMRVIHGKIGQKKKFGDKISITFGNFDGVHLGHQELIKETIRKSPISVVATFNPHPKCILKSDFIYDFLTPLTEKIALIRKLNPTYLYIIDFDLNSAKTKKEDFIKYLHSLNVEWIIAGDDWRFGYRGEGTIADLAKEFQISKVKDAIYKDQKISSTLAKKYIKEGNIKEANCILGNPYSICGIVVKGNSMGSVLGFRTANLDILGHIAPKNGVYAVNVYYKRKKYLGMCNIGYNPTVNRQTSLRLETHILDFQEMIYGESIRIAFLDYLRPETEFSTKEELIKQLKEDEQRIRVQYQ